MAPAASAAPTGVTAVDNVKDFGATGNGSTNDSPAIDRAITAANAMSGGATVRFPSGTYTAQNTIHMKSNVTLQLDSGATIRGASNDDYDAAESNPFDSFQDVGPSHFHDAMIFGDRLTNIGFVGPGVIDGGGNLITGNPGSGEADKILSLTRCNGLRLGDGITLRRGGHFAALINGCTNVTSDHLTVDTGSDRDGWNIISTTNVTITNANITGNDDALVFKSDFALGAKLPNGHVTVTDSHILFFSSRRRHTRFDCDWSSDVCSSDLRGRRRRGARPCAPPRSSACSVSGLLHPQQQRRASCV